MLIQQQHQLSASAQVAHKSGCALPSLRKDGPADARHRLDVMGVKIGIAHGPVEATHIKARLVQRDPHRLIITKMPAHEDDGALLRRRLLQCAETLTAQGLPREVVREISAGVILNQGAAGVVEAGIGNAQRFVVRHIRIDMCEVAQGAFAKMAKRADDTRSKRPHQAHTRAVGQRAQGCDQRADGGIAQIRAHPRSTPQTVVFFCGRHGVRPRHRWRFGAWEQQRGNGSAQASRSGVSFTAPRVRCGFHGAKHKGPRPRSQAHLARSWHPAPHQRGPAPRRSQAPSRCS